MALLQSAVFKLSSTYYRCMNIARFSTTTCLNKTVEEKLGLAPKPKKPQTPFLRFIASIRPELAHQNVKPTEILKIAGDRWKKVDDITKNNFKQQYEKDLLKYQEDIKKYDLNLSPGERDQILLEKENIKIRKERIQLRKRRDALGCPKKPLTSYLLFLKSKASEKGNETHKEWVSKMGKVWHSLTEQEKLPYVELQKNEAEEYKKKLAKWEKEMMSKGMGTVLKQH